jgi:enamine deaminase RidA (YjgF/YER057c/UK114 family)
MLYLSGQTGDVDGQLRDGFEAQARQSMENVGAVLKARGLGFGDVVKCTVILSDMSKWSAFNAIYVPYFPPGRLPARSARMAWPAALCSSSNAGPTRGTNRLARK